MTKQVLLFLHLLLQVWFSMAEIRGNVVMNKISQAAAPVPIRQKRIPAAKKIMIKPVGAPIEKNFVPLTEIPPPILPSLHFHNGRRHMDPDCGKKPTGKEVHEGPHVEIWGDYYEEKFAKTVATVIFPDHIDHKHFEVTTQVPYLTVGPIEAIGYHPSTIKSEHPSECEKIYQDHIADTYNDDDETQDFSEESLEMARMPLFPPVGDAKAIDTEAEADMYDDLSV